MLTIRKTRQKDLNRGIYRAPETENSIARVRSTNDLAVDPKEDSMSRVVVPGFPGETRLTLSPADPVYSSPFV